jgi:chemotaxis regulatin CheY-phosphate phosphatase CheZ
VDEFLRRELAAASAIDDAARSSYERWKATQAKPQREMVFKTFEPKPQPRQQQSVTTMDAETQKKWDEWCDARIEKMMHELFMEAIARFVADYVRDRDSKLSVEIGQLYAELNLMTGIQRGEIAQIEGKADAA